MTKIIFIKRKIRPVYAEDGAMLIAIGHNWGS